MEVPNEVMNKILEQSQKLEHENLALYELVSSLAKTVHELVLKEKRLEMRMDATACIIKNHKHGEFGELPWDYQKGKTSSGTEGCEK